jgi:hypothetical protein
VSAVALVCALLGALLVPVGVALIYIPAGVVVAGFTLIAASYVVAYLSRRAGDS